jgi:hypothetical protein
MEATMKQLNNERGLGVVYANKANVLRLIKERHSDAEQCFAASIANAEKLLAVAEASTTAAAASTVAEQQQLRDTRNALTVALGNRHMNRGVFKMEQRRYAEAETEFLTAMQLHRSTDNQTGLAMTSSNCQQCNCLVTVKVNSFVLVLALPALIY